MKRILVLLAAGVLCGCATGPYQADAGNELLDSTHARVSTQSEKNHLILIWEDKRVYITRVNGKPTGILDIPHTHPDSLLLKPGKYTLGVSLRRPKANAHGTVQFHAEAGKSYIVKGEVAGSMMEGSKVKFWVEEDLK